VVLPEILCIFRSNLLLSHTAFCTYIYALYALLLNRTTCYFYLTHIICLILALFYLLLNTAVTNSYNLYKIGYTENKKLSYTEFKKRIVRDLLREPEAILRQRRPRPPHSSLNPHTKAVHKGGFKGHYWAELESHRYCQVCNPRSKGPGRPRKAL
jgi:hypothetical protein